MCLIQLSEFVTHGTQQQKALLPLSRIKRVMRADDSVAMIGEIRRNIRGLSQIPAGAHFPLYFACAYLSSHLLCRQRRAPHHVQSLRVLYFRTLRWFVASCARAEAPHIAEEGRRCRCFQHAPLQLPLRNHAH